MAKMKKLRFFTFLHFIDTAKKGSEELSRMLIRIKAKVNMVFESAVELRMQPLPIA